MSTELLDRLARLEREGGAPHDPRWDLLARGALSREETAALLAASSARGADGVPEAFVPLDAAARERLARRSASIISASGGGARPSRLALAGAMAAAFCAAAILISLIVALRSEPIPVVASASGPVATRLPDYHLEVSGGDSPSAVRSVPVSTTAESTAVDPAPRDPASPASSAHPSVLSPGASLVLVLRPSVPAGQPVSLRACSVRDGRAPRAREWPIASQRSEQGAFRVEGTRESLFAAEPPGEVTLVLALAAARDLPSCEELASTPRATSPHEPPRSLPPEGVTLFTHRVVLR